MTIEEILTQEDVVSSINNNIEFLTKEIPELKSMFKFDQHHPHHHLDVWEHTLLALSFSNNDFKTRLALLLHDIGKPYCYQDEYLNETEFVRHFHGHADVSADMSREILKRLGYDRLTVNEIVYLIQNHDTEITKEDIEFNPERATKRLHIQECDSLAHHPDYQQKRLDYIANTKELIKEVTMDKKSLRKNYKDLRKAIPNKEEKSKKIFEKIINDPLYQEAQVIALYNSFNDEVDTQELIAYSRSIGKTILLPRTFEYDIIFFAITDDTRYAKSKYGIIEPQGGLAYSVDRVDLVIVPGLAFDKKGNRLGYGKGYYDRFLEAAQVPKIGICFAEQIIEELPTSEQDVKMDIIETDKGRYYGTKELQLRKQKS